MSFAEQVKIGISQLMGSDPQVAEKTTVTLQDVSVRGWWKNRNGDKIHVDPEKMFIIDENKKKQDIVELETVRKMLSEGGYALTSLPPEERIAPVASETEDVTPSAQVVDLNAVRVATGGESVSPEQEHKNALALESEQVSAEIEELKGRIYKKFTDLAGELGKKKKHASVRASGNKLFEEATAVYQQSLVMKQEEMNGKELTNDHMTAYRTCLESLRDIDSQVDALVADFETLKQPVVAHSIETGNAKRAEDNLKALLQARANAPKAPEEVTPPVEDTSVPSVENTVKDKGAGTKAKRTAKLLTKNEPGAGDASGVDGGGPEGPEGGEGLATLLKARQEKVEALIKDITTPQGFAEFRRTLRKVEVKDSQEGAVRWYFIDQDTLAKELSEKEKLSEIRRLSDDEKKQVYVIEDFLRDKLRRKFFELKDTDVDRFYNQEQAKIIATQSEADLDALVAFWPKQLGDIATWKDLFDTLTGVEKNKIDDGYREAIDALKQEMEVHRRELQLAPAYQALDAFLARGGDKAKEKVRMFQEIIDREYGAWSNSFFKEAKKIGGTISSERRWVVWQEQGGDAIVERVIVAHLQRFDGIDPEEGKKIFQALRGTLMEKTNQEAKRL